MLVRHNSMLLSTIYLVGTAKIVCCREEYSIFPAQDILLVLLKILFFKDDKKAFYIYLYIIMYRRCPTTVLEHLSTLVLKGILLPHCCPTFFSLFRSVRNSN